MKAGRIHYFGPPNVIVIDEIPCPRPEESQLVVRGCCCRRDGPWDALIREGKSVVQLSLPIILGSDFAGIVDSVGTGVIQFKPGDEVFGVTNEQFCGAYAEYAVASAQMVAARPRSLSFVEARSVPVVAVTAYQMLFDYAQMKAGQALLIHGAAGNVGAYAVRRIELEKAHRPKEQNARHHDMTPALQVTAPEHSMTSMSCYATSSAGRRRGENLRYILILAD